VRSADLPTTSELSAHALRAIEIPEVEEEGDELFAFIPSDILRRYLSTLICSIAQLSTAAFEVCPLRERET
jgi:hypothetical protein